MFRRSFLRHVAAAAALSLGFRLTPPASRLPSHDDQALAAAVFVNLFRVEMARMSNARSRVYELVPGARTPATAGEQVPFHRFRPRWSSSTELEQLGRAGLGTPKRPWRRLEG